jgi:tRNA-dihydrouridine synthase B
MVSAKGLVYGGKNTQDLLATTVDGGEILADGSRVCDRPLVVQIFGAEAEFMERAVQILKQQGFRWFDVNMGCSVPKVTKTGAGAAMLKDISHTLRVAEAVIQAAGSGMAGFKLRLGWDAEHEVYAPLAARLADMGAGWITLHPRYAVQGFAGTPRYSALTELAELSVPVIASGDLFTAEDGVRVLRQTGVDSVMYARGALKNPAIFARHKELLRNASEILPSSSAVQSPVYEGKPIQAQEACKLVDDIPVEGTDLEGMVRRHALLAQHYSPHCALLKMRTFVPRYIKNRDGAKAMRQEIVSCSDWETLDNILNRHFNKNVPVSSKENTCVSHE